MKKLNKSYVIRFCFWLVASLLGVFFLGFQHGEFTPTSKLGFLVIGSLFLFAFLLPFEAEKVNCPPQVVIPKQIKLKWSPLMSNCSWDRACEIIRKKGKGWRFPTIEEFKKRPYLYPYDFKYWLDDRHLFSESFHKEVIAARDIKAHLFLVREI